VKTPGVVTRALSKYRRELPPHMFPPLAPKYSNTTTKECSTKCSTNYYNCYKGLCYKLVSRVVLDRIPGCGRWQTSHCRAIVQVMVRGGPSWSAIAHNRGLLLFTAGRCTRTKERKCGRCSDSVSGATFHGMDLPVLCRLSLGIHSLDVDCRCLPVPSGFEVVSGRGGGVDPLGAGHG